ncbi:MAG: DUF1343 domain-containing protein [Bacteroidales bacterium]|jgi:uncharacterized protein YbbC (DUF1343 family)|nr:DUF1343 domain-containing protein [Bacteroidales bacterium]
MLGKNLYFLLLIVSISIFSQAQSPIPAADQTNLYFPQLNGNRIGIIANQTSLIADIHLVDSLLNAGINIQKVFAPEHGFRGEAEAGAKIINGLDSKTALPIISLYGSNKKPSADNLIGIDLLIFDIQDVGARFYTYISTLAYVMEACAENDIPLMILDRPNPNAHYVDGPVLEKEFQSFVGLLPIPVVHGMTLGELAQMINGESWLKNKIQCELSIIPIKYYNHQSPYHISIAPSPNLPNDNSIALYPTLCFFEGTAVSIGRGTDLPFEVIGYPDYPNNDFSFQPKSIIGKSVYPKFENQVCYGLDLQTYSESCIRPNKINLQYIIDFYSTYPNQDQFFTDFFNLLAGNDKLQQQIKTGLSENKIRQSWEPALGNFKIKRKRYLLYPN